MHRRFVSASLLLAGIALLAGCGQKGPLVLPPPKPAVAAPTPAPPAARPAPAGTAAVPASTSG